MLPSLFSPEPPAIVQVLPTPAHGSELASLLQENAPVSAPQAAKADRLTLTLAWGPEQFLTPSTATQEFAQRFENTAAQLGTPIAVFGRERDQLAAPVLTASTDKALPVPNPQEVSRLNLAGRTSYLRLQTRGENARAMTLRLTRESASTTSNPAALSQAPTSEPEAEEPVQLVEVTADRQEFDQQQQVITAEGDVVVRFAQGVLSADRLQVNLQNRLAVAQGEVALRRGEQVLRGDRFEYSFARDRGTIINASGEIYQPTAGRDFDPTLPTDASAGTVAARPVSDRILANQPLQNLTAEPGFEFEIGAEIEGSGSFGSLSLAQSSGTINRLRFRAERVEFESDRWQAENISITNDPFSPPELEIRADTANFRSIGPQQDEITTTNSRIVFDQATAIPIFQDRIVLDRRERAPGLFTIGFDGDERGGLFLERSFEVFETQQWRLQLTPQYFLQQAILEDGVVDPGVWGLESRLEGELSDRTTVSGRADFIGFDFGELSDDLRASLRLQQAIGTLDRPHLLNLEYSFRDRLFNGSLGFQTVRQSIGAVVSSPTFILGQTGINLSYQGGIQHVIAETDEDDLLDSDEEDEGLVDLMRYQGAVALNWGTFLWQGETLPPTPQVGLRYSPIPVRPYLQLVTGVTGVTSFYGSGDSQQSISGSIGLEGQIGHFSRPVLDYTAFNIRYTQVAGLGESPFLFDRLVDRQRLSFGITQQVYGPFRIGFQTSRNLNTNEAISTDYFLDYNRRTYNVRLRYNPVLELGSVNLQINGFNWSGSPNIDEEISPVREGVVR